MIRDIVKDEAFLSQKAEDATLDDVSVAEDLVDTLKAHSHEFSRYTRASLKHTFKRSY